MPKVECDLENCKHNRNDVGDTISRQAAIDAIEKCIMDCNPDHFVSCSKFIEYMHDADIGSFGQWQFANGFNMGVTASKVAINVLQSEQPEPRWIPVEERLPEVGKRVLVTIPLVNGHPWVGIAWHGTPMYEDKVCFYVADSEWGDYEIREVTAWMPLPKPYERREDE